MPNIGTLPSNSANRADRVVDRLGIAGTVGQKDAVGLERQDLLGRRRARQDRDAAALVDQVPGDVPLHAEVQGHDVQLRRRASRTAHLRPTRRPSGSSHSSHCRGSTGTTSRTRSRPTSPGLAFALATRLASSRSTRREHALHRTLRANPPHQRPRIDSARPTIPYSARYSCKRSLRAKIAGDADCSRARRSRPDAGVRSRRLRR